MRHQNEDFVKFHEKVSVSTRCTVESKNFLLEVILYKNGMSRSYLGTGHPL